MGFFPFGIGIHECPGRHFAFSELRLVLIAILRKYKMGTENGQVPEYNWRPVMVERKPTKVIFKVNFEFNNLFFQKSAELFFGLIENQMIESFKKRAKEILD